MKRQTQVVSWMLGMALIVPSMAWAGTMPTGRSQGDVLRGAVSGQEVVASRTSLEPTDVVVGATDPNQQGPWGPGPGPRPRPDQPWGPGPWGPGPGPWGPGPWGPGPWGPGPGPWGPGPGPRPWGPGPGGPGPGAPGPWGPGPGRADSPNSETTPSLDGQLATISLTD